MFNSEYLLPFFRKSHPYLVELLIELRLDEKFYADQGTKAKEVYVQSIGLNVSHWGIVDFR